jgi:hypothetical protein
MRQANSSSLNESMTTDMESNDVNYGQIEAMETEESRSRLRNIGPTSLKKDTNGINGEVIVVPCKETRSMLRLSPLSDKVACRRILSHSAELH